MPSAERRRYMSKTEVSKSLKTSGVVPFWGERADEHAEDFLQCVDEVVTDDRLADVEILCAISTVLRGGARRWWRINRDYIATWSEFKVHFKRMYIKECDEADVWTDSRRRT